jgi:hypothetical protein
MNSGAFLRLSAALLALVSLLNCAAPPAKAPPPYRAVATLEEVMHGMVIPNAQTVWQSVGMVNTAKGMEEFQPKTEDDWIRVEAAAVTLTESGNLLMMDGRAKDNAKWMELCQGLVKAGESVHQAAKKRDPSELFTRGGDLFDACQACHFTYRFEKDPTVIRTH